MGEVRFLGRLLNVLVGLGVVVGLHALGFWGPGFYELLRVLGLWLGALGLLALGLWLKAEDRAASGRGAGHEAS